MVLVLQVVSSRPVRCCFSVRKRCLTNCHLPGAANQAEALNRVNFPRLVKGPGGKVMERPAIPGAAPDRRCEAEMLHLLHSGSNGKLEAGPGPN
jgi:hypothetical protein